MFIQTIKELENAYNLFIEDNVSFKIDQIIARTADNKKIVICRKIIAHPISAISKKHLGRKANLFSENKNYLH